MPRHQILGLVVILVFIRDIFTIDLVQIPNEVLAKGREKYETIQQNSRLPQYSDCWTNALSHLNDGCRVLTDSIQSDLALHFTNCFLLMSGSEELTCVNERTEALKRLCIKEMPDRAYHAYLEFFSDAQNMCYFLQHQSWHKQTEKTIDTLSRSSQDVADKLQEASEVQNTVLAYQQQGLYVQQQLLEKSVNLSESLVASKQTVQKLVDEVQQSTESHKGMLDELFKEFHVLHNWLVGRYSLIDKVLYYATSVTLIMIATSFTFTSSSRVFLIGNLCLNYLLELSLPSVLSTHTNAVDFDSYSWMIRKLFIFSSILIFIYFIFKYEDKFERQMRLLAQIESQNRKIIDDILYIKLNKVGRERVRDLTSTLTSTSNLNKTFNSNGGNNGANEVILDYSSASPKKYTSGGDDTLTNQNQEEIDSYRKSSSPRLPILLEIDDDGDENDATETLTPEKFTRSVSRASTVSQSSSRYNLRRRTDIFHAKE